MAPDDRRLAAPAWGLPVLRLLQVLRFAVLGGLVLAYLGREQWPLFYSWLRLHVFGVVALWVGLLLAFRILRAWLRRQQPQPATTEPWRCAVCERVNPPEQEKCLTCTVPRSA